MIFQRTEVLAEGRKGLTERERDGRKVDQEDGYGKMALSPIDLVSYIFCDKTKLFLQPRTVKIR